MKRGPHRAAPQGQGREGEDQAARGAVGLEEGEGIPLATRLEKICVSCDLLPSPFATPERSDCDASGNSPRRGFRRRRRPRRRRTKRRSGKTRRAVFSGMHAADLLGTSASPRRAGQTLEKLEALLQHSNAAVIHFRYGPVLGSDNRCVFLNFHLLEWKHQSREKLSSTSNTSNTNIRFLFDY